RKLKGGVAVIYTGAPTELEMLEKKDRIEDAMLSTKSALRMGYTEGAGTAYREIAMNHFNNHHPFEKAFRRVLVMIRVHLYESIGVLERNEDNASLVLEDKLDTLDLVTGAVKAPGYYKSIGVIDSVEVLVEALQNAFSVAKMILRTSAVIHKEFEIINGPPRLGGYQEE